MLKRELLLFLFIRTQHLESQVSFFTFCYFVLNNTCHSCSSVCRVVDGEALKQRAHHNAKFISSFITLAYFRITVDVRKINRLEGIVSLSNYAGDIPHLLPRAT